MYDQYYINTVCQIHSVFLLPNNTMPGGSTQKLNNDEVCEKWWQLYRT